MASTKRSRRVSVCLVAGTALGGVALFANTAFTLSGPPAWIVLVLVAAGGWCLLALLNLLTTLFLPSAWLRNLGALALAVPNLAFGPVVLFAIHGALRGMPDGPVIIVMGIAGYLLTLVHVVCVLNLVGYLRPDLLPEEPVAPDADETPPRDDAETRQEEALVGASGNTRTPLRPVGKVVVDGAVYTARSRGEFLDGGCAVVVIEARGAELVVEAAS